MPRSIINLVLENQRETNINHNPMDLVANQPNHGAESIKGSNDNSIGVFGESQLRDITEVLEVQSRSLIRSTNGNPENFEDEDEDDQSVKSIVQIRLNSDDNNNQSRNNNNVTVVTNDDDKSTVKKETNQIANQCDIRSASGLCESFSNSFYSTGSSSFPVNEGLGQVIATDQGSSASSSPPASATSPSPSSTSSPLPTSATVTVSTCPSCGSENVDPCLKPPLSSSCSSSSASSSSPHHHRYSNELSSPSSKKWKSYSRPELVKTKSKHRSSPYKIKSHCLNASIKQSSRHHHHHHHHHGHSHGHHYPRRSMTRSSIKKQSMSQEIDKICPTKSKSKSTRYCSKLSSTFDDIKSRCHVCKQFDEESNQFTSFNGKINRHHQRSSSATTIKGDCPYSLTTTASYDDDHLMSHLCDIESWHRRRKRETLKKKERAIIAILSIVAVLIFIAMSYFGTILFLRITTMPIS